MIYLLDVEHLEVGQDVAEFGHEVTDDDSEAGNANSFQFKFKPFEADQEVAEVDQ